MRAEVAYQLPGLSHLSRSSRRRRIAGISEVCRGRAAGVFGFIMTSSKLRKYLAYYQKTLREEPENIEARLRLAAVFRDMGREAHAIEEYATASRLLAREGLALEAIAACKAILEDRKSTCLNSSHVRISYAVFCLKKKKIVEFDPIVLIVFTMPDFHVSTTNKTWPHTESSPSIRHLSRTRCILYTLSNDVTLTRRS